MVVRGVAEKRNAPEYSLEGVYRAAAIGQVYYTSTRVQRHVDDLCLTDGEVWELLSQLRPEHFDCSIRYEQFRKWHDVYLLPHPVPANPSERLYIKFRLDRDCVWIELCSFHPEGWQ